MKKIAFSDKYGLTDAVLNGRKTQTRRTIPQSILDKVKKFRREYFDATFDKLSFKEAIHQYFFIENIGKFPYQIGEVVAVAQSYAGAGFGDTAPIIGADENDMPIFASEAGVYNKMFVCADLMPHQIRITDISVERLQDISDEECIKEGIVEWDATEYNNQEPISQPITEYHIICKETSKGIPHLVHNTPKGAFADLMHKLKRGIWEENPWVFVYEFELVK